MKIDLSGSRPYRKMGRTCRTRAPAERRVVWTLPEEGPLGDRRFRVQVLRRDLVESAAELWRAAYPEVYGSPHEFLLDPDRYEHLVAFQDTWEKDSSSKVHCMSVVEDAATGKVVAATLLTKFEANLEVEFSFAATHPDYRRKTLTDDLRYFTRMIALRSGAEYFTTFCETWHDITQNWCVKGGWNITGISPGRFIRWNGDGEEYRACTVHFCRFVGKGAERATQPEEWYLAPEVKEIWELMERVNRKIEERFQERVRKAIRRRCALSP